MMLLYNDYMMSFYNCMAQTAHHYATVKLGSFMSENDEPKTRVCRDKIEEILSKVPQMEYESLFNEVNNTTGHGRPTFDAALNQLIGAKTVKKRPFQRIYQLSQAKKQTSRGE